MFARGRKAFRSINFGLDFNFEGRGALSKCVQQENFCCLPGTSRRLLQLRSCICRLVPSWRTSLMKALEIKTFSTEHPAMCSFAVRGRVQTLAPYSYPRLIYNLARSHDTYGIFIWLATYIPDPREHHLWWPLSFMWHFLLSLLCRDPSQSAATIVPWTCRKMLYIRIDFISKSRWVRMTKYNTI